MPFFEHSLEKIEINDGENNFQLKIYDSSKMKVSLLLPVDPSLHHAVFFLLGIDI